MDDTWDCIDKRPALCATEHQRGAQAGRAPTDHDAEGQSNRVAHGIGGLLGHDTRAPLEPSMDDPGIGRPGSARRRARVARRPLVV